MTTFSLTGCVLLYLFIYIYACIYVIFNLKLRLIKLYLFHVATKCFKLLLFGMMLSLLTLIYSVLQMIF